MNKEPKNPFESVFGTLNKTPNPKEESLTEQQRIGKVFLNLAKQYGKKET